MPHEEARPGSDLAFPIVFAHCMMAGGEGMGWVGFQLQSPVVTFSQVSKIFPAC